MIFRSVLRSHSRSVTGICGAETAVRRSVSSLGATVECDVMYPDPSAPFERTTPVLFLRGPWHSSWVWESTMAELASRGFESRALRHTSAAAALGTVAEEVAIVAAAAAAGGPPPLLVAHGLGAFVAQKYLESHPASGLVLVAPFPPNPRRPLARLRREVMLARVSPAPPPLPSPGDQLKETEAVEVAGRVAAAVSAEPAPGTLVKDAEREDCRLNLEPASHFLPLLVAAARTDPVVGTPDVEALLEYHGLSIRSRGGAVGRAQGDEKSDDAKEKQEPEEEKEEEMEVSSCIWGQGVCGGHLLMAQPEWGAEGGLQARLVEWVERHF